MSTILERSEAIRLEVFRCYTCGRFWAREPSHPGRCPVCAQRQIDEAEAEVLTLTRRLNSQKAATVRAGKKK